MTTLTSRQRTIRLHLRSEVAAVEASTAVFAACILLLGLSPAAAIGWGVLAGLVAATALQVLRLLPTRPAGNEVNLLGFDPSRGDLLGQKGATAEKKRFTPAGVFIVAIASPLIIASVVIRFALLYLVPTVIVAALALTVSDLHPVRVLGVWGFAVLASLANEYAVVRPLAQRSDVPL